MTVEDAMKWTFSTMTAYQNPEKEFGYNIRHAWGREGGGKGIGKDSIQKTLLQQTLLQNFFYKNSLQNFFCY